MYQLDEHLLNWLYEIKQINIKPLTVREIEDHFRQKFGYRPSYTHELLNALEADEALNIDNHQNETSEYEDDNEVTIGRNGDMTHVEDVLNSAENGQRYDVLVHFFNLQDNQYDRAIIGLIDKNHVNYVCDIVKSLIDDLDKLEEANLNK